AERLASIRRLVARAHARGLPWIRLCHAVDLLRHLLVAHLELLLPRDRREQDLAAQRSLDALAVAPRELLLQRLAHRAALGGLPDHPVEHPFHQALGQLEGFALDELDRES